MSDQHRLQAVGFDELAISNKLTLNALVELLDEKGLLGTQEVLERVKRLRAKMAEKRKGALIGTEGRLPNECRLASQTR